MRQTTFEPTLSDVLRLAIDSRLYEVQTSLPAKVTAFYPERQMIDVQPLLLRSRAVDGVLTTFPQPIINNVPIEYPAGGGWSMTWPLTVDDLVMLSFCQRSIDLWLDATSGELVDPVDSRMHDLSDAVARSLSARPKTDPIADISRTDLRIVHDSGVSLVLSPSTAVLTGLLSTTLEATQVKLGASATHPVIQGDTLLAAIGVFATLVAAQFTTIAGIELPITPKGAAYTALAGLFTAWAATLSPSLSLKVVTE